MRGRPLPSPGLVWQPDHTPYASHFGDVYFSREGGLAEARHVFLGGCDLPRAWQIGQSFTIGELGFGTGLNFLVTWDLWRKTRRPGQRLHYISVEGYPLTRAELGTCLKAWPELADLAHDLLDVYPEPQPGFHRLFLQDDGGGQTGVFLTLLYGDVANALRQMEAEVDAWFLDGFSPDRNPEMWRSEVFAEVARLSHARDGGTRFATYSAAGDVRRGLDGAGFEVEKVPGFGHKREMLRGRLRATAASKHLQPWFAKPRAPSLSNGHAAIIGGGIAGTSTARALQRRGWRTTLIDRHNALAAEASGNPAGILMPRLTAAPNLDGRFYASAWRFTLDALKEITARGLPLRHDRCGLLQLATDETETARQAAVAMHGPLPESLLLQLSAAEASDVAGHPVPYGALYFPQGGWLQPRTFCEALSDGSTLVLDSVVATLRRRDMQWEIVDPRGGVRLEADIVICANALGAGALPFMPWLPLKARRGQITLAPSTSESAALRSVLTYGGYITPAYNGQHCIGATFDWVDTEALDTTPAVTEDGHARNLAAFSAVLPNLMKGTDLVSLGGRASLRCTTLDHLPLVGPVPDHVTYLRDFAELRHGHPWARYPDATYHEGLYVMTGLGARGLVAAPLAAEMLAAQIMGEPWPVERDLMTALHPGRFLVRDLKRREA